MAKKIYQIRLLELAGESEPELKDIIEFELEEDLRNYAYEWQRQINSPVNMLDNAMQHVHTAWVNGLEDRTIMQLTWETFRNCKYDIALAR